MFVINNDEIRNLEEQVQKNKEDIAKHYEIDRALANLGIKVIGQLDSVNELPDPLTFYGNFGDAFAVGNKQEVAAGNATYDYYVYSRANLNVGQATNYWLNVGKISIAGPQGPQGPQGEKGETGDSTYWIVGSTAPSGTNQPSGTMYLNTLTGDVYRFETPYWILHGNIKGPQGIQGPQGPQGEIGPQGPVGEKGETGDPGAFIHIAGVVSNADQLPLPSQLNDLSQAYLVGTAQPYDLYIQIGKTPATATWNNIGPLNTATLVTVNGQSQNVWSADTKVDKVSTANIVYGTDNSNANVGIATTGYNNIPVVEYTIPKYNGNKSITLPDSPVSDTDAANKTYVDTKITTEINTSLEPINDQLAKTLKVPTAAPPRTQLVSINQDKSQSLVKVGSELVLRNRNELMEGFTSKWTSYTSTQGGAIFPPAAEGQSDTNGVATYYRIGNKKGVLNLFVYFPANIDTWSLNYEQLLTRFSVKSYEEYSTTETSKTLANAKLLDRTGTWEILGPSDKLDRTFMTARYQLGTLVGVNNTDKTINFLASNSTNGAIEGMWIGHLASCYVAIRNILVEEA